MRLFIALAVFLFAISPTACAAVLRYASPLAPEVIGATGSGKVTLEYDDAARTLGIMADFSGLSGTTTVAHVHCCTADPLAGTAGVAVTPGTLPGFPAGVSSGNYATIIDLSNTASYTAGFLTSNGGTTAGAEAALIAGLDTGQAYFNVHSTTFAGGEIRGFPTLVPEPSSCALLIAGFIGSASLLRRRCR